jgi:hypothetical protein
MSACFLSQISLAEQLPPGSVQELGQIIIPVNCLGMMIELSVSVMSFDAMADIVSLRKTE